MSDKSGIEWTDATWNPVTGCTEVSPGCDHCYAKTFAERWRGVPGHHFERGFDVVLRPERLDQPIRWRKPRRIFVNSMSDLFHEAIPDDYIARVWAVMATSADHTFQVLTKRHGRMRSLLNRADFRDLVGEHWRRTMALPPSRAQHWPGTWPLPNVWLGVSVESQQWANIRIPALLDTPAAVRFLSCEPLLGAVSLFERSSIDTGVLVDWVIAGGESGRDACAMHPDWARALRDECVSHGIPFHFKQWGEWKPWTGHDTHLLHIGGQLVTRASGTRTVPYGYAGERREDLVDRGHPGWVRVRRVGKKAAGRELDGRTWDEFPPQTPLPGTAVSAASTPIPLTGRDPARTHTPAGQGNPT